MPWGVISNVVCLFVGGVAGTLTSNHIPEKLKLFLPEAFAIGAIGLGINGTIKTDSMPAVMFALILGAALGGMMGLEAKLKRLGEWASRKFLPGAGGGEEDTKRFLNLFSIAIILSCSGATGIYGAIHSGVTGDHSILYSKAVMDLFTAAIFATTLGMTAALMAVPMLVIFLTLYYSAVFISPFLTPGIVADFSGCGGLLIIATGLRMADIRFFHVADMLPAMVLVMPASYVWNLIAS